MAKCSSPVVLNSLSLDNVREVPTLRDIVEKYESESGQDPMVADDLRTTVDYICGINNDGHIKGTQYKKHWHQRYMSEATIDSAAKALGVIDRSKYQTFDELYDKVLELTSGEKVRGFGNLATYDFVLRYCYKNKLKPCDKVYLHAGSLQGAAILYNKGYIKRRPKSVSDIFAVTDFPELLQKLEAEKIQKFLCLMRKSLNNIAPNK